MCEVCESIDKYSIHSKEQGQNVIVFISSSDKNGFWFSAHKPNVKTGFSVLVNYCPFCGADLIEMNHKGEQDDN